MTLAWRWMIRNDGDFLITVMHWHGKLTVFSALNEPLNAEIEFTSATEKN
jgi:hypothetical protein